MKSLPERTSEPLEIAEALVKLRQETMTREIQKPDREAGIASSFVSNTAITFQRRVDRLLALVDSPCRNRPDNKSHFSKGIGLVLFAGSVFTFSHSSVCPAVNTSRR